MLLRYLTLHRVGLVLAEHALLMAAVLLSFSREVAAPLKPYDYAAVLGRAFFFTGTFQIFLHLRDAYDFRIRHSKLDFSIRLVQGIVLASLVILLLYFVLPALAVVQHSFVLVIEVCVLLAVWHVCLRIYFAVLSRRSGVLILGTGRLARALATEMLQRPEVGMSVCGFLDDDPSLIGISIVNPKVLGLNKDIRKIVSERPVSKIIVELQDRRGRLPIQDLLELKTNGVSIEDATTAYER